MRAGIGLAVDDFRRYEEEGCPKLHGGDVHVAKHAKEERIGDEAFALLVEPNDEDLGTIAPYENMSRLHLNRQAESEVLLEMCLDVPALVIGHRYENLQEATTAERQDLGDLELGEPAELDVAERTHDLGKDIEAHLVRPTKIELTVAIAVAPPHNRAMQWWLFAHLFSVVGFLLAHGHSAAMGFRLRQEKSTDAIRSLTELSRQTTPITYVFLLLIIITGVILGFQGHWWGRAWIWSALVVLIVAIGAMGGLARRYYKLREAVGVPGPGARPATTSAASPEAVRELAATANPWPITAVGVVALLVLLWLMILKPF